MYKIPFLTVSSPDREGKRRIPWIYVSSTYFAEGVPYIMINSVSVVMYQNMGISKSLIGLTSILYLPWVIKMFWGPTVDLFMTKRFWIILTQAAMAGLFILAALGIHTAAFFIVTLSVFIIMAFVSATHDIATDGFYMLALSQQEQAFFVGIRSLFYRIAMWFGLSIIVGFTGIMMSGGRSVATSWFSALVMCGGVFIILALFHRWYLPRPDSDKSGSEKRNEEDQLSYFEAFRTYFTQKRIAPILAFILLYRLGEGMLTKMVPPFLLDSISEGGLALTNTDISLIQGNAGLAGLITGGILGGWLIARYGLRTCIWPMVFALNLPDVFYIYLAHARPAHAFIYAAIAIEQFGYGLGFTAFTVFLMYIAKEKYKTSHFAISTGLMALGMMVPGMVSGFLQEWLGYYRFFIAVLLFTIPGMLTIFFIPLDNDNTVMQ